YTTNNDNTVKTIDKNGIQTTIIDGLYNDESIQKKNWLELGSSNYLPSSGDKVVTFAFENIFKSKQRYTYLDGGVIYIHDTKGNLLETIQIIGTKKSNSCMSYKGNYFFMNLDEKATLYNLNSGNKISTLNAPSTGQVVFSEDETIALIGGNVIDLEKEEIIKWISTGDKVAIADKGYPIVAFTQAYEFFVVDYEKEEILFREDLSDRKYHGPCHNIQISGDGKEVSVVFRDLYRKYRIGGRK
ncbi:MAG: hypothetical protein KAS49_06155, partial [Candidatus Cloacimonetes bacterium]|nr:hypothetical protein [Candidatus Cloacimonadota bacterium]